MFKFGIIFAVIGVIFAQDCKELPALLHNGESCCKMKENENLENREALNDCVLNWDELTCDMTDCVLEKLKLLKDGKLDQDAIGAMFDASSIKLPDFKDVYMKTKQNCLKDFSIVAKHIPCDSIKLFLCGERFFISRNGNPCCEMPSKMGNQDLRDNLDECGLNTKENSRPTCEMMDCFYNKLKLLKDGKLDQDAFGAMLDENSIQLPDFKDVFMKIKQNCDKDLSTVATHIPCDSIKLTLCWKPILIADCPAKFWNNSEECGKLKEFVEKCPSIF